MHTYMYGWVDLGKEDAWMGWMDGFGFGFQLLLIKFKCLVIRASAL